MLIIHSLYGGGTQYLRLQTALVWKGTGGSHAPLTQCEQKNSRSIDDDNEYAS